VLDGAVLSGRVHRLEDDEERMSALGRQPGLVVSEQLDALLERVIHVIGLLETERIARIEISEAHRGSRLDE
jgi:hypothetical protein